MASAVWCWVKHIAVLPGCENKIDVRPRKTTCDWPKLWISLALLALGRAPRVAQNQTASTGGDISASELLRCVASETPRDRCDDWLSRVADPVMPLPSVQTRDPRTCSAVRKQCSNLIQYSGRGLRFCPT